MMRRFLRLLHDAQILAALQDFDNTLLEGGCSHNLEVVCGHKFCCLASEGSVDNNSTAKGSDAIAPEGLFKGGCNALVGPGCSAGIVVFDDECSGLVCQVLQNVGSVVHVREVGLAGMLACLDHLLFAQARDNAVLRTAPGDAAKGELAFCQLVEGSGLVRVFAIP